MNINYSLNSMLLHVANEAFHTFHYKDSLVKMGPLL